MKNTQKFISAVLVSTIAFATLSCSPAFSTDSNITVELDGNKIAFDVEPKIIDGRTMVPLRKIFEEIGALVKWDSETQTVSARKSSKTVSLSINSNQLEIDKGDTDANGNPITETVTLEVPAQIVSDRTLVPARAVSEAFGLDVDWDEKTKKVTITSDNEEDESWKENKGTINLTDLTFSGNGIEIKDKAISITSGGDFTLSGTLDGGNITVSTKEKVKFRLNGVSIVSDGNPCIYVEDADKMYITLSDGSENRLIANNSDDGAIYSKENLEIKGGGTLEITSADGHAIKASDNLTIENGTLNLDAFNDGIHINDTFKMTGGIININATGDGIDCESIVNISGGEINIKTNGVPLASPTPTPTPSVSDETTELRRPMWGGMSEESADVEFEKSSKGINAEWMMKISGGKINVASASHSVHCEDEAEIFGGELFLSSEYEKGISIHGNLTIDGSDTVIDITKSTEGIESKNVMTINDGTINIISSDDGINATGGNSGAMPPGGVKGAMGEMPPRSNVQSGDENGQIPQMPDGTNMPGGGKGQRRMNFNRQSQNTERTDNGIPQPPTDEMPPTPALPDGEPMPPNGENGRMPGRGGFMGDGRNMKICLTINGGDIEISGGDDCIDTNGNLVINGGTIKAVKSDGSFSGNFAIIDPDGQMTIREDATLILAAGGRSERNLSLSQNTITLYCEKEHTANESITVTDDNSNVIFEYAPTDKFSSVLISSPKLETGKTYTVSVSDEIHTVEIEEQSTVIGTKPERNTGFGRINFMQ